MYTNTRTHITYMNMFYALEAAEVGDAIETPMGYCVTKFVA